MELIPTIEKETLPKGFSYPCGAEVISKALKPHFHSENAKLRFDRRDVFRASEWNAKIKSKQKIILLTIKPNLQSQIHLINIYAVPSDYRYHVSYHLSKHLWNSIREKVLIKMNKNKSIFINLTLNLKDKSFQIS
jgi:hypothetical protein